MFASFVTTLRDVVSLSVTFVILVYKEILNWIVYMSDEKKS
jgi:hypothetical protein